jgi:predicted O-methyltransferase YrrM
VTDPPPERLEQYVADLFAPEDDVLRALRAEMVASGLPDIAVSPVEGRLLQVLLRAIGARRVLEIGTLGGYSAIWMARALPPDGRLVTLEIDAARADFARDFARRAGLDTVIDVRVGPALDSIRTLEDENAEPFDACFIDADKEGYPAYLDAALRLVRTGGLILGDNVLWSGRVVDEDPPEETTRQILAFNRRLAEDPRVDAIIVPVRDGLSIAVVRDGA